MSSYTSLTRITASPIAPASLFEIADAADAALLDVRREISIFMASIVRLRNYRVGRAGCHGALPRERFSPLALSGHAVGIAECLISGEERTWLGRVVDHALPATR
jgi:hypothetical protein